MLKQFVLDPTTIGAVAPSSDRLAREMVEGLDWETARLVVECGPGTGAVTPRILERLAPGARFLAVEINDSCAREFRQRHPQVELHQGCVSELPGLCQSAGQSVDIAVSSLPWAAFTAADQERLLAALHASLSPSGRLVSFAYAAAAALPAGRRFRRRLERTFSSVERSRIVWRNLPPAFVYRCRK